MGELLSFLRTKKSRRASPVSRGPAPEPPCADSPPVEAAAAPPFTVVRTPMRDYPLSLFPMIPYAGALLLSAALANLAVHAGCAVTVASSRMAAAPFEIWRA